MLDVTATLEDWHYDPHHEVIWGCIYGDTKHRFPDGAYIHTSHIQRQDGEIIYTLNSVYKLGHPKDV